MICAIILAAGRSRRMGTQKLLLPFAGDTVIGHIVGQILASPIGQAAQSLANTLAPHLTSTEKPATEKRNP